MMVGTARNWPSCLHVFLGTVAQAALDVFESEPPPPDHPLVKHPQVSRPFREHLSLYEASFEWLR